jgi:hypothetical protein
MFRDQKDIETILSALGEQLESSSGEPVELLVCGGSALIFLGHLGLPERLMERVTTREFGRKLTILFLGRYDQIHFKLYAAVDQGAGIHFDDLLSLNPTAEELEQAARWSMTHDVSEGYRQILKDLLNHMGYSDVAKRL